MKITKIEKQKNNKDRYNLFTDNEFWLGVSKETLVDFGLKKDKKISSKLQKEIKESEEIQKAWQKSLRYLSYRARSEKEIEDYLIKKEFNKQTIRQTIKKLEKYDYINNKKFSKSWIENRKNRLKGPYLIKSELIRKGIDGKKIEQYLNSCYNQEEQLRVGIKAGQKRLSKKRLDLENYKESQKIFRYLAQRGFDYDIIKDVINKLKKTN
jgi:regulatory protein